jgi:hypothetical protein
MTDWSPSFLYKERRYALEGIKNNSYSFDNQMNSYCFSDKLLLSCGCEKRKNNLSVIKQWQR